jgi:predicted site-specific integrase-resolvase
MDSLLTPEKTAELLGVSMNTLACWRSTKRYPLAYLLVGSRVRYRASDIERFLEIRTQTAPVEAHA